MLIHKKKLHTPFLDQYLWYEAHKIHLLPSWIKSVDSEPPLSTFSL